MTEYVHESGLRPYLEARIEALSRQCQQLLNENAQLRLKLIAKELRSYHGLSVARSRQSTASEPCPD
jgi:hypothetical protein